MPFDHRDLGTTTARSRRPSGAGLGQRTRHPRAGRGGDGRMGPPQRGAQWKAGAEGELVLAAAIAARCGDRVVALHDRVTPGGRVKLDHLLVAPSGVWVVDSELARGRVAVTQSPSGATRLEVGGQNRTALAAGLATQLDLVNAAMATIEPMVLVRGALCLITPKGLVTESGLPVIRPLVIGDLPLVTPQRLASNLAADGLLSPMDRTRIARALAQRFPARVAR